MRTAFILELMLQARSHPEISLVVGDLGYPVVEPFAREFPDRFLNAGVAEQNMTGVAAGLPSEGYHVFTCSIANFPTVRCLEQVPNDICYHQLAVTVVSVGARMSYGNLGYSHHAMQDIGILRTLPSLTILSPADPGKARERVQWLAANPCPSCLPLGKAGEAGGNTTQSFGFGRMAGQLFALLYLSAKPLCLDDIVVELGVSKASVSTTVRQREQWAAVRRVWVKGDRKDDYEAETDFGKMLQHGLLMAVRTKLATAGSQLGHVENSLKRAIEGADDTQRQEMQVVADRLQRARDFHGKIHGMLNNPVIDQLLEMAPDMGRKRAYQKNRHAPSSFEGRQQNRRRKLFFGMHLNGGSLPSNAAAHNELVSELGQYRHGR